MHQEIDYSHFMCCCTKTCFQIPRLVFWSSAWGWKLQFFQYTILTSTSSSSENEGCSMSTQTPELQDGCAAPAHLQTSLAYTGITPEENLLCISGLLHHSRILKQWKFQLRWVVLILHPGPSISSISCWFVED